MQYLKLDSLPELRAPVFICAFAGWNDAASAATNAARFIVRRFGARKFGAFDPEPFFDFREVRPHVQVTVRGEREITWPPNDVHFARNPTGPHDVVVFTGTEPNLKWRTFASELVELAQAARADLVVTLGALLADVPHTRPVRVTGSSLDPAAAERLGLQPSRYEGPTGIVGVLHTALRDAGLPGATLWANVPHYLTSSQNPGATAALLRRVSALLEVEFDLSEMDAAAQRFVAEVEGALRANPEAQEYVRRLEATYEEAAAEAPQLPRGEDLVLDIERFLREQREGRGEG
ncbi:PAC2 family protein [Tepidiforma sp.]|uniref:PAC2 family protein n=1 Tax=Tepidiforma sp. TaxID=2682230 RepID=UPI002618A2EE|nr:PAC2 family protein [Tepidiforma sp.]MCX7616683.1 PAC2 family protein [Tepidiforma sp.]